MITEKAEAKYLICIIALYFAVSLIGILHHELWLDEAHHWLLARDSSSFSELLQNRKNEGHPVTWNILLFMISRFTANPFWMQFFHIVVSTIAVSVFVKKAPFSLVFKTLFIFGYFFLFEYNIISRNYNIGILFLFLACNIYRQRNEKFTLYCLYLIIAANIHLLFATISCALLLTFIYENRKIKTTHYWGYTIFFLGLLLLFIQVVPSDLHAFERRVADIPFYEKFIKGFISLFKGIVTIPDFSTIHFWNSNWIVNTSKTLALLVGALLYFLPLLFFYKRKNTLFFTYTALIGVQFFFFVTQTGATRFDGITYLIIIIALWIDRYYQQAGTSGNITVQLLKKITVYTILIIQFCSGILACTIDYKEPFSSGKAVAGFLNRNKLSHLEVATLFCEGTIIAPYLNQKPYFVCQKSRQSFCDWSFRCDTQLSGEQILTILSADTNIRTPFIFISKKNILENPAGISDRHHLKVEQLTKLQEAIVRNTDYYLYKVSNTRHNPQQQ